MQYIYFEVLFRDKVLDGGIMTVEKYDPTSEQHAKDIINWVSEYVVPFCAPPESVEKGEIQIRYREMTQDEYDKVVAEDNARMKGLPYA